MEQTNWKIEGSGNEAIHGTTHKPCSHPKCNLIIAHGFKGYKDYGLFPWLAERAAETGANAHRFNFSHSGMLADDGPFERTDLFENDTWNKQVEDLQAVVAHCENENLPTILLGHSRGGVASLLAVGRDAIQVDQVISLSAPSTCNPLNEDSQRSLLNQGYIESPSSRTNQMLRIGRGFLDEQLFNPELHDLLSLVATIEVPITVIHGDDDETVLISSGEAIVKVAKNAFFLPIYGGNHVFNTPNPFSLYSEPSEQLQTLWESISKIITLL
ncbi:alpha/beta hydrolase [PVC group bacterium]|nr:alpha/beta hydrolase [PVC group bacterium]